MTTADRHGKQTAARLARVDAPTSLVHTRDSGSFSRGGGKPSHELEGPNPQAGETAAGTGSDCRVREGRTSAGQPCVRTHHGRAHECEEVVDTFVIDGTRTAGMDRSSRRHPSGSPPSASAPGGFNLGKGVTAVTSTRKFESGELRQPPRPRMLQNMPESGTEGCRRRRRGCFTAVVQARISSVSGTGHQRSDQPCGCEGPARASAR